MLKTYKLAHLAVALGGEKTFRKCLSPLHELQTGGVFVAVEAFNAEWRLEYGIDSKMLCPPGGSVETPVLPPAFTERELLQFLTLRSDIAHELDTFYCNDKPKPAPKPDDGAPYPLDEQALAEIEGLIPEFAAMLRKLLSKGGKWWVNAVGQSDIPETQAQVRDHSDDQVKCDELARLAEPAYVRIKSPEYSRLREMLIDWGAYRFRDLFTLYEMACLLNRMEPRAVLDEACLAIRRRGGVAAEMLNNPAATAEMLHLNPVNFYAPPVGYALVRLQRAEGSQLGVSVKADRLPELADMLGVPYPPELEREVAAPTTAQAAPKETAHEKRERLLNWWDVAGPFMVETLRAGQYATAKELSSALTAGAGKPDSPFDKGEGQNRGSLFVREIGKPLSLKTIRNNWQRLRGAARS